MRRIEILVCVYASIWFSGCQVTARPDCWSNLISRHDQLYNIQQMGALDTDKGQNIRAELQVALRTCPADVRFAEQASKVSAGLDSYLTLLDIAIMADNPEMTRALAQKVASNANSLPPRDNLEYGGYYLQVGVFFESANAVKALLELGWDPNVADEKGVTALHVASAQTTNGLAAMRHLVAYGGDPNRPAVNNVTPMMLARLDGDLEKALCLFQLGAKVPTKSEYDDLIIDESHPEKVRVVDAFFNSSPRMTIPEHIARNCTL